MLEGILLHDLHPHKKLKENNKLPLSASYKLRFFASQIFGCALQLKAPFKCSALNSQIFPYTRLFK